MTEPLSEPLSDQQAATEAALVYIEALASLVEIESTKGLQDGPGTSPLSASKDLLEREIISLIARGDGKEVFARTGRIVATRSIPIVEALPDTTTFRAMNEKDADHLLEWAGPEEVRLLARKGIIPYVGLHRLMDDAPPTPEWDAVFTDVLSPMFLFPSCKRPRPFLIESRIVGEMRNHVRLAAVLRAQVRDHQQELDIRLQKSLTLDGGFPPRPRILLMAGARLPESGLPPEIAERHAETAQLLTSNHGVLELLERHHSLEDVLQECVVFSMEHPRRVA